MDFYIFCFYFADGDDCTKDSLFDLDERRCAAARLRFTRSVQLCALDRTHRCPMVYDAQRSATLI